MLMLSSIGVTQETSIGITSIKFKIITEKKGPETEELIKTVHAGQLNVQKVIHDFYLKLYEKKPCNDAVDDVISEPCTIALSKNVVKLKPTSSFPRG